MLYLICFASKMRAWISQCFESNWKHKLCKLCFGCLLHWFIKLLLQLNTLAVPIRKTWNGMCETKPTAKLFVLSCSNISLFRLFQIQMVHSLLYFGQMKSYYCAKWAPLWWIDSMRMGMFKFPWLIKISCKREMCFNVYVHRSIWKLKNSHVKTKSAFDLVCTKLSVCRD